MSKALSVYIYMMNDKYFHRMTIIGNILDSERVDFEQYIFTKNH